MLLVNACASISKIHGIGLIAQEFIPKGTRIWEFREGIDLQFTSEQLNQLSPVSKQQVLQYCDGDYDPELGIYTLSVDDARFTNHADQPNTVMSEEGRITVATKDIQPGEEITWNYQSLLRRVKSIQGGTP